jgi:fructokinase
MATAKIVTLGEVLADVYCEPAASDAVLALSARPGGAPANVAVAAVRLGAEAAVVGRLGDDPVGDFILRALEADGVDVSGTRREPPPVRTTLAFVETGEDGEREFTFYRSVPAADELLAPDDIDPAIFAGASFANFGSIPLLGEPVRSATHRFARLAREAGVPLAFDVNHRAHLWQGLAPFREAVGPLLDLSTVVKLSADELGPVLDTDEPADAAERLFERGAALVLVSRGEEGAFYASRAFRGEVPAYGIERVVDATGAGDAFLAATLTHLAEHPGWAGEEAIVSAAVRRGNAAGALACSRFGAMEGLPTRDELERFMG